MLRCKDRKIHEQLIDWLFDGDPDACPDSVITSALSVSRGPSLADTPDWEERRHSFDHRPTDHIGSRLEPDAVSRVDPWLPTMSRATSTRSRHGSAKANIVVTLDMKVATDITSGYATEPEADPARHGRSPDRHHHHQGQQVHRSSNGHRSRWDGIRTWSEDPQADPH